MMIWECSEKGYSVRVGVLTLKALPYTHTSIQRHIISTNKRIVTGINWTDRPIVFTKEKQRLGHYIWSEYSSDK